MPTSECGRVDMLTWQHVALFAITTLAGLISAGISAFNRRDIHAVKRAVNGESHADAQE